LQLEEVAAEKSAWVPVAAAAVVFAAVARVVVAGPAAKSALATAAAAGAFVADVAAKSAWVTAAAAGVFVAVAEVPVADAGDWYEGE